MNYGTICLRTHIWHEEMAVLKVMGIAYDEKTLKSWLLLGVYRTTGVNYLLRKECYIAYIRQITTQWQDVI